MLGSWNWVARLGLAAISIAAIGACDGGWQSDYWDHYDDTNYLDMVCDKTGCFFCDDGRCEEYRCDYDHQCPGGRVCTIDQRCLPSAIEITLSRGMTTSCSLRRNTT